MWLTGPSEDSRKVGQLTAVVRSLLQITSADEYDHISDRQNKSDLAIHITLTRTGNFKKFEN
jgi:hypothetical protein